MTEPTQEANISTEPVETSSKVVAGREDVSTEPLDTNKDRAGSAGCFGLVGQESAGRKGRVRSQTEGAGRSGQPHNDESVPSCGRWRRHARRHARRRFRRCSRCWWRRWSHCRGGGLSVALVCGSSFHRDPVQVKDKNCSFSQREVLHCAKTKK